MSATMPSPSRRVQSQAAARRAQASLPPQLLSTSPRRNPCATGILSPHVDSSTTKVIAPQNAPRVTKLMSRGNLQRSLVRKPSRVVKKPPPPGSSHGEPVHGQYNPAIAGHWETSRGDGPSVFTYPAPQGSLFTVGNHAGNISASLILFHIYYASDMPFNVHEASANIIESMVRSQFIGREDNILLLRCPFHHLGDKATVRILAECRRRIMEFAHAQLVADFIICVNTHASSSDGGLLYKPGAVAGLNTIVQHICDDMPLHLFRASLLFALCCGGLVRHDLRELQTASLPFCAAFAFDAPLLDPILICTHFVTVILDFSIMRCEPLWQALNRAAKPEVLNHAAVYMVAKGDVYRMRKASLRLRPNGEDIRCCNQLAEYRSATNGKVLFRCSQRSVHQGSLYFRVEMLPEQDNKRWVLGNPGRDRYMIDLVEVAEG